MVAQGNEPDIIQNNASTSDHYDATNVNEQPCPSKQQACDDDDTTTPTAYVSKSEEESIELEEESTESEQESTYWNLLTKNRPYILYFISSLFTYLGEWFTYVACLSLVAEILPGSYIAVSLLVVLRLLPPILLTMFGGTLADAYDRRLSMITLDCVSSVVALLFVLVLRTRSLALLYVLVFLQAGLYGLYEPVKFAIIPMLVTNDEDMKKATTLTTVAWSVMAAFGASAGGMFVAVFGMKACFVCDAVTFLVSAALMGTVGGTWKAGRDEVEAKTAADLWEQSKSMTGKGIKYLRGSFFGPLVFIKLSGSFMFGPGDILNVAFSEVVGDEEGDSIRLGGLFTCVGIGCIIGPLISNRFTDMKKPETLQFACIFSYAVIASGFLCLGLFESFSIRCFFTMVKSSGASIMWTNSTILLQIFCDNNMLGRVSAIDYGLATLAEATSAFIASILHDRIGFSAEGVCYFISIIGFSIVLIWAHFHNKGGGAASTLAFNRKKDSYQSKKTPDNENSKLLEQMA